MEEDSPSLREQVKERIRQNLFQRVYEPGSLISAKGIARELQISRTPVRDAMMDLAREGFIKWVGISGAVVQGVGTEDVLEMLTLRYAIETQVAQKLAREKNPLQLKTLRDVVAEMKAAIPGAEKNDEARWGFYQLDIKFHRTMSQLARMKRAEAYVTGIMDEFRLFSIEHRGKQREVVKQHAEIVDTIEQYRDNSKQQSEGAIRQAVKKHLLSTAQTWAPSIVPSLRELEGEESEEPKAGRNSEKSRPAR